MQLDWPKDCPRGPEDVATWASENRRSDADAWRRVVHFLTAVCIARDEQLRPRVMVSGGAALWLAHSNARTPGDFDLAVHEPLAGFDAEGIRRRVNDALRIGMPHLVADYARSREQIHAATKVRLNTFRFSPATIPLDFGGNHLDVIDLDYSLAQKFVSLTNPPHRLSTGRNKDVFDLCFLLHAHHVDLQRIGEIAREIARAEDRPPPRLDEAIRERAQVGYENLRESTGQDFIDFEHAWGEIFAAAKRIDLAAKEL